MFSTELQFLQNFIVNLFYGKSLSIFEIHLCTIAVAMMQIYHF